MGRWAAALSRQCARLIARGGGGLGGATIASAPPSSSFSALAAPRWQGLADRTSGASPWSPLREMTRSYTTAEENQKSDPVTINPVLVRDFIRSLSKEEKLKLTGFDRDLNDEEIRGITRDLEDYIAKNSKVGHVIPGFHPSVIPQLFQDSGDKTPSLKKKNKKSAAKKVYVNPPPRVYTRQVDELGRAYAKGGRKRAIAHVWVSEESEPGPNSNGSFMVNGLSLFDYFPLLLSRLYCIRPLEISSTLGAVDVSANVRGSGKSGQAQAVQHALAKALVKLNPDHRPALRQAGLLTRDSRVVERKKPGLRKARKREQWKKR